MEGLSFSVDGVELSEGARVRLELSSGRLFGRRVRVDGTIVRVSPASATCAIRFSPVRKREAVERYVESAARAANVNPRRTPAYGWAVARAVRLLAAELHRGDARGPRLIVVTSPSPGDGKSFLATSLALEVAAAGGGVLLVDADLHRPSLHTAFGVSGSPGVGQLLSLEGPPVQQCLQPTPTGVTILPAGVTGASPVLTAAVAASLAACLKTLPYSTIIVDTPPVLAGAETLALAGAATDVIVAVRSGQTRDRDLRRAVDLLTRHGAPVRGVVLNDHRDVTRSQDPAVQTPAPRALPLTGTEAGEGRSSRLPVGVISA